MAGCGNMRWLENRAVCTLDGKEAHTISKYGPLGIASRLADADAAVLCWLLWLGYLARLPKMPSAFAEWS